MFDEYDIPKSLKPATMHVWLGDIDPVAFHITEREGLPKNKGSSNSDYQRAQFQWIRLYHDTFANLNIPSPSEYGWNEEAG